MKRLLLLLAFFGCYTLSPAQEFFISADFVSQYIWRGLDLGNAAIQPSVGIQWKGLTAYAWASTEFRNRNNEIDLSLEYNWNRLTLYANNYFTQTEDEPFQYFHYNAHTTGHTFEFGAEYEISERFPLSVKWFTTFAGNDYRENDKRAWSSYTELSYPFTIKEVDLSIEAGFTPWEGLYADKFQVVNLSLSATKSLQITSGFSLALFGKVIANPAAKQAYVVFGITL